MRQGADRQARNHQRRGQLVQRGQQGRHNTHEDPAQILPLLAPHHRGVQDVRRSVRLAPRRDRDQIPAGQDPTRRNGWPLGGAKHRRAGPSDDTEHISPCRCVRQERDAGSAAPQGDHQRQQEPQDTVTDRVFDWCVDL